MNEDDVDEAEVPADDMEYVGKKTVDGIRVALGVSSLVAVALGILTLCFVAAAMDVIGAFLGVSVVVSGVVYAGIGILARKVTLWSRIVHILLGIIMIVAGVIAFRNPVIGILTITFAIGFSWIVEGVVSLSVFSSTLSAHWGVGYGLISIIAGLLLLLMPFGSSAALIVFAGVSLIIIGGTGFLRAFFFAKPV